MERDKTIALDAMRLSQTLWVCTTRTCNFDCAYCYQGSHAEVPAGLVKHMPDEVLERALQWLPSWVTSGLQVIWYGGEPLLERELIRRWTPLYADAFKRERKALQFSVTTNGSFLDAETRAFLDEWNVGVLLSLDGPPELHDLSRTYYDRDASGRRRGTWRDIPVADILAWRPHVEIAWQLSPGIEAKPEHLDYMIDRVGFHAINFNLQWLEEWPAEAQLWLTRFFKHVALRSLRGDFACNWTERLKKALTVDQKMVQPCGTGLAMLGLSPEGWLYPSQEMVYTVVQPGRAPGTAAYYRVGDVFKSPVIDAEVLARVSTIRTEQMRPPAPFDCKTCVAHSVSIGGCHCRYVGQDGYDPSNRFDVALGYCQSMVAAMTGLLQGAAVARWVRPAGWQQPEPGQLAAGLQVQTRRREPTISDVYAHVVALEKRIDGLDIVRLEAVEEQAR